MDFDTGAAELIGNYLYLDLGKDQQNLEENYSPNPANHFLSDAYSYPEQLL